MGNKFSAFLKDGKENQKSIEPVFPLYPLQLIMKLIFLEDIPKVLKFSDI